MPHYDAIPASQRAFFGNIPVSGGPASVRACIATLLPDVIEGRLQPGRIFDRIVGVEDLPTGYRAMDSPEFIKVMVKPQGVFITPLAKDELDGPRGAGYRRMIELCPAKRRFTRRSRARGRVAPGA